MKEKISEIMITEGIGFRRLPYSNVTQVSLNNMVKAG